MARRRAGRTERRRDSGTAGRNGGYLAVPPSRRLAVSLSLLLAVSLSLLLAVSLAPGRALAHAYLERSSPAGNTIVETAPTRVQLWFTERPELRFSEVTVYTAEGDRVRVGPLSLAPDNPRSVIVEVGPVANGTYTVAWRTLSMEDGHTAAGAFAYAVGLDQPPPTAASIFVPAGQADDPSRPSPLAVLARWLGYVGAAIVGGGPFFLAFVLWPALRMHARSTPRETTAANKLLIQLHRLGLVLVAVAAVLGLLAQALSISGNPALLAGTLVDLLGTRGGLLIVARLVALGIVAFALHQLRARGWYERGWSWTVLLALLGTLAILAAQALGSHAAATSIWPGFSVAVDLVHLAAMAVWLGGLAVLALAVPPLAAGLAEHERTPFLAAVIRRFSTVALWCVGLLALTGLYQSWVHVGQPDGLWRTGYGQALVAKLGLILPLLALAAFNLLLVRPGLARAAGASARQAARLAPALARRLRLAVFGEVALGAAILLATGLLTNLPPAREALLQMGRAQSRSTQVAGLKLTLTVDPAVAGLNTYDLAIADARGRPIDDAERVALRFRHTEHDMGENEAVLRPRGDGHYTAQGSFLSMAGLWEVDARVRLPGREDAAAVLEIPAADPGVIALARASQAPSLGTNLLLGLELLAAALLLAIFGRRLRLPLQRPLDALLPRLASVAVGVVGLCFASIGVMNDLTPTAALANPIPPTRASLERGKELYEQQCLACHGEYGRGDGPMGRALRPRPADLRTHVAQHTEGQLYWWVSKGFPGSAMPAFEVTLSEEDRWHVLNYVVQTFRVEPGAGG